LAEVRLRVASERTATASDCVPAIPPVEATIGISAASTTSDSIVASNCVMTTAESDAVNRFTTSHGNLSRAVVSALSVTEASITTPESRRISSSCSSSSTFIASSMVMTPTSRPAVSTTGVEIRWYLLNM
jgi:hypothetical protein